MALKRFLKYKIHQIFGHSYDVNTGYCTCGNFILIIIHPKEGTILCSGLRIIDTLRNEALNNKEIIRC
jgi:hypothetical protein